MSESNTRLYVHFHPDEHPFVDKASEWIRLADEQHLIKQTPFLDPRQAFILEALSNRIPGVKLEWFGGYPEAERKRCIIAPAYKYFDATDFSIQVVSIESDDSKFKELVHGDFLGALLGLGMKREKLGDLHLHPNKCHALVASEMINYVHIQLSQVHRVHVRTEMISLEQLEPAKIRLDEMSFTVASLRLDAVASDVYRISRTKMVTPIKSGHCRVNWKVETDPGTRLQKGDIISTQGLGRFMILEADDMTKKGRIRVKAGKFA